MALRRLLLVHSHLQGAVSSRATGWTTWNREPLGDQKPVCPGNAFTLFLETQPREGKSLKKFVNEAACKWNALPEVERKAYQEQAKDLEKKYHDELAKWEQRMLKKGREDLVEKHHQLTDGKNLAIRRYRQGVKEPLQDFPWVYKEAEEESSIWEGTDSVTTGLGKKMKSTTMGGVKEEMMGGMKEEMMGGMKEEMMGGMKEEVETSAQISRSVVSPKSLKYRYKKIILVKTKKHHQQ